MTESILIVYALREEVRPILKESRIGSRILKKGTVLSRAEFRNVPIAFCQTGVGVSNARAATERALEYFRPGLILSIGCAGGTAAHLKTGDLVLPSEIRNEASDRFETSAAARDEIERLIREEQIPYETGPLMTLQKLGGRPAKEEAGRNGIAAVDMETAAVASVAEKAKIPLVSLRVIFDALDEDLPFAEPFDEDHPVAFLLQNPKAILKAPKYVQMNKVCQINLSRVVSRFIDCYGTSPTEK